MCFGDTVTSAASSDTTTSSPYPVAMRKPLKGRMLQLFNALANGNRVDRLQLARDLSLPESSVAARIRDLRKESYGGYKIEAIYRSADTKSNGVKEFDYLMLAA